MSSHKVDFVIGAEDYTAIQGHVTGLTQKAGAFLIGMDDRDRNLRRLGGKSEQFVMEALALAKANPAYIPPTIDMIALERDKVAREQLLPVYLQLAALTKQMSDTLELLGIDLIAGAFDCYKALKLFGKAAGLDELVKDLGKGFARPSTKKDTTEPTPTTPANGTLSQP
ncbi:hypothetical protein ACXR0O_08650 [Verrucomicrobiota bacterium sgz303538]